MPSADEPPILTVVYDGRKHSFAPSGRTVLIGRGDQADVHVPDPRISRAHVRVEVKDGQWIAFDNGSLNGMFVDGARRDSALIHDGLVLHVGNTEGTRIAFVVDDRTEVTNILKPAPSDADDDADAVTDAGVARAGAATAARRRELEITQRNLAKYKIINAGALIAFEKGRSWPRNQTRAKLEEVLQWPTGTIERIRNGAPIPGNDDAQTAQTSSDMGQEPLIIGAVDVAMKTFSAAVDALPSPDDPEFTDRIGVILADLRELEDVVTRAARQTRGTPATVKALSAVRKRYAALMFRAATAPTATLGQLLYVARKRADLSREETAHAAGLPPELIDAVESELPVTDADAARVAALITAIE
ncbi:MAG: FHA domain-containing protein [Mycobacterium sp.]